MPTENTKCNTTPLIPKCCEKTTTEQIEDVYGGETQPTFPNVAKGSVHVVQYTDRLVYYVKSTGGEWVETVDVPIQEASDLTLTTTGTSGAATLVDGTLNIPQYATLKTYYSGLLNAGSHIINHGMNLTHPTSFVITVFDWADEVTELYTLGVINNNTILIVINSGNNSKFTLIGF